MGCQVCEKGEYVYGTTTHTVDKDGKLLVIRAVPATMCNNPDCGEVYIEDEVAAHIEQIESDFNKIGAEYMVISFQKTSFP